MKKYVALIFILCLLTACIPSNSNEGQNKFTFKQNALYFSQRFISNWKEEFPLPVCTQCSKQIDKKHTEDGPMFFRQINDGNGDLVFFYVTGAQHSFALKTGSGQYSAHLEIQQGNLLLSVNRQQIKPKLNEIIKLKLGTQYYYCLLEKLNILDPKTENATSPTNYQANIIIWLDNH